MTAVEIIQIIISVLTLLVTAVVPIMIYWMQKRHEKEIEKIQEKQYYKELSEKANAFLIDHENERDYLPWCVVASAIHRQEHHCRKIYTDFCRSSTELQNEILKQAGLSIDNIVGDKWIDTSFDEIRNDIKDYKLGRDWLYDGAKYFHRGFERYREDEWVDTPRIFDPINKDGFFKSVFPNSSIDIGSYIDEYFYYYLGSHKEFDVPPIPPIDYVEQLVHISSCEEKEVCRWIMDLVHNISIIIHNRNANLENDIWHQNITDAQAETYEDKYYETLLCIFYTYCKTDSVEKIVEKKHKTKSTKNKSAQNRKKKQAKTKKLPKEK